MLRLIRVHRRLTSWSISATGYLRSGRCNIGLRSFNDFVIELDATGGEHLQETCSLRRNGLGLGQGEFALESLGLCPRLCELILNCGITLVLTEFGLELLELLVLLAELSLVTLDRFTRLCGTGVGSGWAVP